MKLTIAFTVLLFMSAITADDYKAINYYQGLELAEKFDRPLLVVFTDYTCPPNKRLSKLLVEDKQINSVIENNYILAMHYVDDGTKLKEQIRITENGQEYIFKYRRDMATHLLESRYPKVFSLPLLAMINHKEEAIKKPINGKIDKGILLEYLNH